MTSTDLLLDFVAGGVRAESYEYELLDSAHNRIGILDASASLAPRVRIDTTRSTIRTLTGLTVTASDLSGIDVLTERVRPVMLLENGARESCGIFMFGADNRAPQTGFTTWTPDMFDETFDVDQPLPGDVGLPPGGSILTLAAALLAQVPNLPYDLSAATDAPASTATVIGRAGTSRHLAVTALAKLLGCYAPYIDRSGIYLFRPAPPPGVTSDHSYGDDGRVIDGSYKTVNSSFRAPNRYQVVSDGPDASIVGIYDLPAAAPNSYAAIGRYQVDSVNQTGIPTVALANIAARINALTDRRSFVQATFDTPNDPRHEPFDLVDLYGIQYQETGCEMTLATGGVMTHSESGFYA